ncbi:acyl-CoA dehydrogenase family protein [Streptomyces mexicanus]|uniref:Acyl-CoA dehydrogenase family protein n=1 Tax=Streptomyces mexicanus TaxID=178566 RepID=A0A7X1HYG0_9ACTN|nr:acyl-CoA dehydrogenase family protein [Streptomyces mexicanus]MBC2864965.1 acyl-CoA dehydrogenase family protein [Streptomyces mexicanus]
MDLHFTPEDESFRDQARTWLEENRPREARPDDPVVARPFDTAWQRRQFEAGWAGINWPSDYGGRNLSLMQQLIWYEEYARSGAPTVGVCFVGLAHAGPTLITRGTEQQKAEYLPKILRGDIVWCQGFSEPDSGSDLASLRTRAVVDGDHLVVNGQKIWTSYAQAADVQELLVRTDPDAPKHKGITWVINDMRNPGMDIRPIRNLNGVQDYSEVFYDNVRIPLSNVVGEINDGWSVAMSTLSFERGTAFMADIVELGRTVEELVETARETPSWDGKGTAWSDDHLRVELCRLRAEVASLRALNYATVSRVAREGKPGAEASIVRLYYGLLTQRVFHLAAQVVGPGRAEKAGNAAKWSRGYLNSFRAVIAAGTKDIQRTIIGERVLGLPKDR